MNRSPLIYCQPFSNITSCGVLDHFTFTGKEQDSETGYGYFGARYYDSEALTGWLSVDPMSDKYPSISPYAYCAWNPVKLVDPDGKEVVFATKAGNYYWYKGAVYADKWHTRKINTSSQYVYDNNRVLYNVCYNLTKIYTTKEGKAVLNALCDNKETYNITNDKSRTGNPVYSAGDNTIRLNGRHPSLSVLSHEIFHAFQDENHRAPHTIYNEVEAYVFQGIINDNKLPSQLESSRADYQEAGKRMVMGEFSVTDFNMLLSRFRRDANANRNDTYSRYGYNDGDYTPGQSLLIS